MLSNILIFCGAYIMGAIASRINFHYFKRNPKRWFRLWATELAIMTLSLGLIVLGGVINE